MLKPTSIVVLVVGLLGFLEASSSREGRQYQHHTSSDPSMFPSLYNTYFAPRPRPPLQQPHPFLLGTHYYPSRFLSHSQLPYTYGHYNGISYPPAHLLSGPNYQSYLYDPYLAQLSQVSQQNTHQSAKPQASSPSSLHQHLQLNTPPFGYIEKKLRNPTLHEMTSEFASISPPKAIMTTAADVLGLDVRGMAEFDTQPLLNRFLSSVTSTSSSRRVNSKVPEKNEAASSSLSSRKKPGHVVSINNFYNKENSHFNYNNNNRLSHLSGGISDGFKSRGKLKSINGTDVYAEGYENDIRDEEEKNTFISEPIISGSAISSSSSSWSLEEDQKDHLQQPHNILPTQDFEENPEEHKVSAPEPIALFTTEAGSPIQDELLESDQDFGYINNINQSKSIYRCPSGRGLTFSELSQAEVFPDPLRCDQFYYCKQGKAYVFRCPINHFFNSYLQACDDDVDFACSLTLK